MSLASELKKMNESLSLTKQVNEFREVSKTHSFTSAGQKIEDIERSFSKWVNENDFRGEAYFNRNIYRNFIEPFQQALKIIRPLSYTPADASYQISEYPDSCEFTIKSKINLSMYPSVRKYKAELAQGEIPLELDNFMREAASGYKVSTERLLKKAIPDGNMEVVCSYSGEGSFLDMDVHVII